MRKRRLLACAMAVIMAVSLIPTAAFAKEPPTSANPTPANISYENGVTLGKTVTDQTNWSSAKEAQVTLTVTPPSPQEPIAVEFVLDATESLLVKEEDAKTLIKDYTDLITKTFSGGKVFIGITAFANRAEVVLPMSDATNAITAADISEIENNTLKLASNPDNKGTNVQAGIQKGIEALNAGIATLASADINVAENNRYLVLVTDGGSFFYYDGETLVGNYNEAGDSPERVNPSLSALRTSPADADTTFEQAIVASADALDTALANKGRDGNSEFKLITYGVPYYSKVSRLENLTNLAGSFVDYAIAGSVYGKELAAANNLSVVVPKGSVITDVIGYHNDGQGNKDDYNFDVMTDKEFVLNFNGIEISGTLDNNSFVFAKDGKTYGTLKYSPAADGTEQFTLTLGQDLLLGQTLELSYYVKLKEPYSSGVHYVYTNDQATLDTSRNPDGSDITPPSSGDSITPPSGGASSDEKVLDPMVFPMPSLKYGSSGGNPGISVPDNPPALNKVDHFGYIIGYPIDYETGEECHDQTRMPVKPSGYITRAEVATIFFRMLTDEARNEFWSQKSPYSDVELDDWFNNAICTLANSGIITGYADGTFKPNAKITRAEFATIAVRFFEFSYEGEDLFPDIDKHWAREYINQAASSGLITGYPDGSFKPQQLIIRAEAITIVNRTLDRHPVPEHFLPDMLKWPDNMDTSKWYYAAMQEATNSHDYDMLEDENGELYEVWTKMLPIRDWEAFEKEWSDSNSAENPGEVVN